MVADVEHPFPVGTRVRCIDNSGRSEKIVVGEEYTVTSVSSGVDYLRGGRHKISLIRLDGATSGGFFYWRFELAGPPKPDVSWWDKEGIEDV